MSGLDPYSGFELPPERRIITPERRQRIVAAVAITAAVVEAALVGFIIWLVLSTP